MSQVQRYISAVEAQLAPCALRMADSGGRACPEPESPYRSCYQRDRDRIIHCSAFRRLDYKTQVFVPHQRDHHRTRLTHSLEVAQVARTLARALAFNEDVAEATALAHDLGHPPFGHAGEAVLNGLMTDHGGFEHNLQSLRVVEYLEHPYPAFRGLNLTELVRRCLARHESRYGRPGDDPFADDWAAPLEGQLVDLADEIAYTCADLYDAVEARWIAPEQLDGLELWRAAAERVERAMSAASPVHRAIAANREMLALLTDDVLAETAHRLLRAHPADCRELQRAGRRLAGFSEAMAPKVRAVQEFLLAGVYRHPESRRQDEQGGRIIADLFAAYLADPSLLPDRYRRRIEDEGPHRTTCDFIAGMTDRYARKEHERVGERGLD
jgi:dGTPase